MTQNNRLAGNTLCARQMSGASQDSMRLAFVISTLASGGAQRVAVTLCNSWIDAGHSVDLLTYETPGTASHYTLDPAIRCHRLDLLKQSRSRFGFVMDNLRRVLAVRRVLKSVALDAVVSFMPEPNVVTLLAGLGLGCPIVVSERIHPAYLHLGRMREIMRRLTYPLAAAVVAQTRAIADYIECHFKVECSVLPNPLDHERFSGKGRCGGDGRRRIVSVGRLDFQKGFDLLIDAFARIAAHHPSWDLVIFGEGGLRGELTARVAAHGLSGRVYLPGVTSDIAAELRAADLYVHAARFEGFPNAVMEALACGCPVIAADGPGGTGELLQGGLYGCLVPVEDIPALAAAMSDLMADDQRREIMGQKAPRAVAHLAADRIAEQWIALLRHVGAGAGAQGHGRPEPVAETRK